MSALFGFAGAAAALGLFFAGGYVGWRLRETLSRRPAERTGEAERRRLREEQAAFRRMQNYTVEDAYGLGGEEERM